MLGLTHRGWSLVPCIDGRGLRVSRRIRVRTRRYHCRCRLDQRDISRRHLPTAYWTPRTLDHGRANAVCVKAVRRMAAKPDRRPRINLMSKGRQANGTISIEIGRRRILRRTPHWIGWIPEDPAVTRAVNARAAVVCQEPDSPAARALEHLSVMVLEELSRVHCEGLGHRLMGRVAYSPKLA